MSVFLGILDRHGLLDGNQRLADDVFLVSIGDHFDYGAADQRRDARQSGLELLTWLASHPGDQVVLIAGNHDLGRVGELADFSDEQFAVVVERASAAYARGRTDEALEQELLADFPALPSAELAARDFAAFSVAQRQLIVELLRDRRLRLAYSEAGMLFCHAGVTVDYMSSLGISREASASHIAAELNRRLDEAFDQWESGPLTVPGIHHPGSSQRGEGVGMLYHRPANPDIERNRGCDFSGALSRRFDARRIPSGLTQVVGHIGDEKSRELLGPWADSAGPRGGVVRHLETDGQRVRYRHGTPACRDPRTGIMVFIDGGMSRTPIEDYELFDLASIA